MDSITLPSGKTLDDFAAATDAAISTLQTDVAALKAQDAKDEAAIAVAQSAVTALQAAVKVLQDAAPAKPAPVVASGSGDLGGATASGTGTAIPPSPASAKMVLSNASLGNGDTLYFHGPWPSGGAWASYDYTLDGGKTWKQAGGFANDGGTFDTWVYNVNVPAGSYSVGMRDHADPSNVVMWPAPLVVTANTAPASVAFSPIKFPTSIPNGTPIGKIIASGGTPHFALALTPDAANSPAFGLTALGGGQWQASVVDNTKLAAGNMTLAGKIASGTASIPFSFTFAVAQGKVVDASVMTFKQADGLSNATKIGSPAFTVGMNGYSGGTFSILSQSAPGDAGTNCAPRYTLTGAAGTTNNTLSAQTEALVIVWTDGVNTCVAPQQITVADVRGTGKSYALTDQATLTSTMQAAESDPLGVYLGATFTVSPGSYNTGWTMPGAADGWNDNSFYGPATFQGAKGVLPQMVQTGAWIPNGKGWLEQYGWDVSIAGLEFANLYQSYPGEVGNFCGIKLNAGVLGRLDVQHAYIHNCTDGIMGGDVGQIVTIADTEFAKCGGGDGFTHNFYINIAKYVEITRVVSWGANVGHCGKVRAEKSVVTDSVFADGPTGCASYLLDFPDGGDHTVIGGIFDKGIYGQNSPMLRYGEEGTHAHPVNQLTVDGAIFVNRYDGSYTLYNGDKIYPSGVEVTAPGGLPMTVTLKNCKFYGLAQDRAFVNDSGSAVTFVDGGGNEYGLPLASAPAQSSYMSLGAADANTTNHPWQAGGYTSASVPGPYLAGPMQGK